jgi:hypothetical protein
VALDCATGERRARTAKLVCTSMGFARWSPKATLRRVKPVLPRETFPPRTDPFTRPTPKLLTRRAKLVRTEVALGGWPPSLLRSGHDEQGSIFGEEIEVLEERGSLAGQSQSLAGPRSSILDEGSSLLDERSSPPPQVPPPRADDWSLASLRHQPGGVSRRVQYRDRKGAVRSRRATALSRWTTGCVWRAKF